MIYKAEKLGNTWAVMARGVAIIVGLTEQAAKHIVRDWNNEADREETEQ